MIDLCEGKPFEVRIGPLTIQAKVTSLDRCRPGGRLLVTVSGAGRFSRRADAQPRFPRTLMSTRLDVPLLSIADAHFASGTPIEPGIDLIAAGTEADVPAAVAGIIQQVSAALDLQPVFIGPSGSGLILLNALRHLDNRASGLVWNPPITIDDKLALQMGRLLARPGGTSDAEDDEAQMLIGRRAFGGLGFAESLTPKDTGRGPLIYLQNDSDSLVRRALRPFMDKGDWDRRSPRCYLCREGRIGIFLGNWGVGHQKPPAALVDRIMDGLIAEEEPSSILAWLERANPRRRAAPIVRSPAATSEPPTLLVRRRDGRIEGRIRQPDRGGLPAVRIAFALARNGQALSREPWGKTGSVIFPDPGGSKLILRAVLRYPGRGVPLILRAPVPPSSPDDAADRS